uniref:Reverse transcriptase domain-containing protein n=1 Tax=Tanacetum cinerariifolium TaxID=118510 RepID=A0A699GP53_TANCI|nr:reverse transcriptase domain-containing protein [Tanacetum cinerariifolium]
MHTRSKFYPNNSNVTIPRRSNRRRVPNIVGPEIRTIEDIVPVADRTMEELLRAPTKGYGEAIVIPEIIAENFEIKTNLLQLVQTNKFHDFKRDNPHTDISNFKRMTATLKYKDVSNDAIKLMLFPYSLEGAARIWYEKEPPNSILTWDDLVNKFVNQFFPPSKTTNLKNEMSHFTQRFEETFGEAWERFKEMLRACPHHGFSELTQIDTFYNGLNEDNANKTYDRINKLADQISNLVEIVNKQVITPSSAKAVEKTCVTCGGAHAYCDYITTDSNQRSVCATTGSYNQVSPPNRASHQIPPPGFAPINVLKGDFNKQEENLKRILNNDMRSILGSFFQNQASTLGTLPSNIVPNPKGEMKVVTTRSGLAYEGPPIPTNSPLEEVVKQDTEEITEKEHSNCQGSTAQVQTLVVPISILEPDVPRTQPKPTIPYPSRLNDQKLHKKATNQMEKFFQIFHDFHFDISFADALLLMPKFASTIKSLLTNKDKLFELAKVPLNENCSAMLLKKFLEKLGDPELTPTLMTLELADRSITLPKGVAEDAFVKVGKFHFPTDFLVMDFEADQRVPLILVRSFLRTGRALIDVYGKEITLRVNNEFVTLNLNQTMRYSSTYDDNSVNRVDVIDIACKEFVQDVLDFQYNPKSRNPTLVSDSLISVSVSCKMPIVKSTSPKLTPFGENEDYKPAVQCQRRVNPKIHDVIKKEVIKLLDAGMIYPISDSPWVSLIHCVPKKGGMTIVANENNELIPARIFTGWRVCIDYRKLNDATRKDHFSLLFMDQMLERLAGNEFYCFLDGFLGYFQIHIDPQDQEKTTSTCPYRTFAYRRMPFGLCNALAYHPQMSGQLEVSNHGLKCILERTVGENRASWAYWALKHVNFDLKTAGDHRKLQLNELSELRDQAYENSVIYKERTKKLNDYKIKNRIFNVGDQVLHFNSRLKIFSGKLKT